MSSPEVVALRDVGEDEQAVVLVAHVTDPEVDGRTVSRGGLHHLGHHPVYVDPWFVDLLLYLPVDRWARFAHGCRSLGSVITRGRFVSRTAFAMLLAAVKDLACSGVDTGKVWVAMSAVAVTLTLLRWDFHNCV